MRATICVALALFICLPWLVTAAEKHEDAEKKAVKSKQYATSLPGAPDGQYVVIQYKTAFENKKAGVETITPMLDKDKKWRVSGYFIK